MTRSALRRGLVLVLGLGLLCAQPAGAASPGSPTAALEVFFERANAIMTDDQKKGWKELTGEPFDIKFEALAGRPGAGRPEKKEKQ